MGLNRTIQLLTGFHYIHSIKYSFGYKLPFLKKAYFKLYGFKNLGIFTAMNGRKIKDYHNCTITGKY